MPEMTPVPAPDGSLQPPGRLPPTAVGTAMLPPPEPVRSRRREPRGLLGAIRRTMEQIFDLSDDLADRIRRQLIGR